MRKWKLAGAARNRMCALLLAFAMLVSMPVTAFAEDVTPAEEYETYTLGDLYMQVDIPADYAAYSEEKSSPESMFKKAGMTHAYVKNYSEENDLSLCAVSFDAHYEIDIAADEGEDYTDYFNYNLYKDAEIEGIKDSFVKNMKKKEREIVSASIEQKAQAKYIVLKYIFYLNGTKTYVIQYQTIYNGLSIIIQLKSLYDEPISDETSEKFEHAINSIYFTETLNPPAGTLAAFSMLDYETYTLGDLHMQIDIPADYVAYSAEKSSPESEFEALGTTYEKVESVCKKDGTYLYSSSPDFFYEIAVDVRSNNESKDYFNLNLCDNKIIEKIQNDITERWADEGCKISNIYVENELQATYIGVEYSYPAEEGTVYVVLYQTIYNGKSIYIQLNSFNGPIPLDLYKIFTFFVINSVHFTETLDPPAGSYAAEAAASKAALETADSEPEAMDTAAEIPGNKTDNTGKTESPWGIVLYVLLFTAIGAAIFGLTYWMIEKGNKKKSAPRDFVLPDEGESRTAEIGTQKAETETQEAGTQKEPEGTKR